MLGLAACSENTKTEEIEIDYGFDYFPLQIGKYIDYSMDSTVYDFNGNTPVVLHSTHYVREMLTDTFTDNSGRPSFKIERFEKSELAAPWGFKNIWYATRSPSQAELVEDNYRLVKLTFPTRVGLTWNAASYLSDTEIVTVAGETLEMFKGWFSEILEIEQDKSIQIGDLSFTDVLTVQHADDENVIEKRYALEKYARGVGLVYRKMEILDTQCQTEECLSKPWSEKAEKGFILTQTVIGYN